MFFPTETDAGIHPVFLEQAKTLVAGGELLPGGADMLAKRLHTAAETQTPLRVKLGLDPTRPDLHLGHSVVLRKLRMFQDLGHKAVLIIGDATALIGDPSGKNQTRPPLTEAEVKANAETYLSQAGKIIDVHQAEVVRNSQWLSTMTMADWLRLASMATVAQLLVRDDFAKRYKANQPIALHELLYPLMQGYDSVYIRADIELGGTDQRFNNLMGRELQQTWLQRALPSPSGLPHKPDNQMVLLMPLLEGTDGVIKMSKSYPEHCINITDAPADMFGKLMSVPDAMILRYQQLLMPLSEAQLAQQADAMSKSPEQGGINPRDAKAYMAKWIVAQYHGGDAGEAAEQAFVNQFKNRQLPDDIETTKHPAGILQDIPEFLTQRGLTPSKAEARRLMTGGGVKLRNPETPNDEGEKLLDPAAPLPAYTAGQSCILQVGKRKFIQIQFE
ncbi:MAG: tyrosine--tRNA ligase [Vampirovibrionales bacterium]|nr:tyrosine--tRNA ligase [Vampirovibrionales bacterium]